MLARIEGTTIVEILSASGKAQASQFGAPSGNAGYNLSTITLTIHKKTAIPAIDATAGETANKHVMLEKPGSAAPAPKVKPKPRPQAAPPPPAAKDPYERLK